MECGQTIITKWPINNELTICLAPDVEHQPLAQHACQRRGDFDWDFVIGRLDGVMAVKLRYERMICLLCAYPSGCPHDYDRQVDDEHPMRISVVQPTRRRK